MCSHWPSAAVRYSQRVGIWSAFFLCVRVHLLRFHVMEHNSSSIFILLISKSRNVAAVVDSSVHRNHFVACLFMPLSTIYWPVNAIATHTELQLPTVTEYVFVFIANSTFSLYHLPSVFLFMEFVVLQSLDSTNIDVAAVQCVTEMLHSLVTMWTVNARLQQYLRLFHILLYF